MTHSSPSAPKRLLRHEKVAAQRSVGFNVYFNGLKESPMNHAHTHPDIELNYVIDDSITYRHGGAQRSFSAGTLVLFWAGVPHQTIALPGPRNGIWSHLPLPWVIEWNLPNDFAGRLLSGEMLSFKVDPEVLKKWPDEYEKHDIDIDRILQLEIQLTLMRLAITLPPRDSAFGSSNSSKAEGGDQHITRITSYIGKNYHRDISVQEIADAVGLNRTYLMHLFRRRCQISLWEYLTRLRVSHAQRLLSTTNMQVLEIALDCGFGSVTPFYNAFSRYVGSKPLEFRRRSNDEVTMTPTAFSRD